MNNNEISGALFDSVQILIDASLAKINYDKTLKYKIKDDNKKSEGIYTVTDGDIEFEAKATTTSEEYKIDDQVYVTITQGDYSQDKVIIGRYVESETNKPITYIAPEDQLILDYEQEFIPDVNVPIGLIADSGWRTEISQTTTPPPEVKKVCFFPFNNYNNGYIENDYTRLILGCEFLNRLGNYNIVSGNYGITAGVITSEKPVNVNNPIVDIPSNISNAENLLAIQNYINNQPEKTKANKDENRFGINYITFDSSEMIGNIYNYNQAISQDVIVDISALQNIVGIFVEIYQKNNFSSQQLTQVIPLYEAYKNKYDLPSIENLDFYEMESNNISIQKVWLKFGYSQQSMEDNTFNLYTQNSLTFTPAATLIEENIKNIKAKWIHKDEELGKLISINDLNTVEDYQNKYQVYWYTSSYEVGDTYAGWGWTRIKAEDRGITGLAQTADPFDLIYAPVTDQSEISIKAVLLEKGENNSWSAKAQSSILTFKNKDISSNASGIVYLEITDSQKEFMFYRQDFKIDLQENFNKTRTIKATIPETRTYENIEIQWTIPRGGTMIFDPLVESSSNAGQNVTHAHYLKHDTDHMSAVTTNYTNPSFCIITRKFTKAKDEVLSEKCFLQGFGINEFYNPTYNRNQIICRVYYDNDYSYYDEGRINLIFGQMGSNGTNYNFGLQYISNPYITCYARKDQGVWKYSYEGVTVTPFLTSDSVNLTEEEVKQALSTCSYTFQDPNTVGLTIGIRPNSIQIVPDNINMDITQQMSNCLQATCTIHDIKLYAYLPIAIRVVYQEKDENTGKYKNLTSPDAIQAPGLISYSSQGGKIEYSKAPLYLFGSITDSGDIIGTQEWQLDLAKGPQSQYSWNIQEGQVDKSAYNFTDNFNEINNSKKLYTDLNSAYKGFLIKTNISDTTGLESGKIYTFKSNDTNNKNNSLCTIELIYGADGLFYLYNITNITSDWSYFPPDTTKAKTDTYTTSFIDKSGIERTKSFDFAYGKDSGNFVQDPYFIISNQKDLNNKVFSVQNFKDENSNNSFKLIYCAQAPTSNFIPEYPNGGTALRTKKWYNFVRPTGQDWRCDKYIYYIQPLGSYTRDQLREDIGSSTKFISFIQNNIKLNPGALSFYPLTDSNTYRVKLDSEALVYSQNNGNSNFLTFLKTSQDGKSYANANYSIDNYITNLLQANQIPNFVIKDKYEADDSKIENIHIYQCQIIPNNSLNSMDEAKKYLQFQDGEYFIDFYCASTLPDQGYIYFPNFYKGICLTEAPDSKHLPVSWRIAVQKNGEKINTIEEADKIGVPSVQQDEEEKVSYLQPYPLYIPKQKIYQLEASYTLSNGQIYLLWIQPLLILQDLYGNPILNKWNGQTNIADSHILSPAIGAGSKDVENRFSGVFMGKVGVDDSNSLHGLYGFHEGAQVFGFKEDGTAFIGKSGLGRIKINGNNSSIYSAKYETENTGIKIDLDAPLFDIKTDNKSLIKFSNSELKLQTVDYEKNKAGALLDLYGGKIEINGVKEGHRISISTSGSKPLQIIGDNYEYASVDENGNEITKTGNKEFSVGWDGVATLNGAKVTGDITAGTIGGWQINNSGLGYSAELKLSGSGELTKTGVYHPQWVKAQLEGGKIRVQFKKHSRLNVDQSFAIDEGQIIPTNASLISLDTLNISKISGWTESDVANDTKSMKALLSSERQIRLVSVSMAIAQMKRLGTKYETGNSIVNAILNAIDSMAAVYKFDDVSTNAAIVKTFNEIVADFKEVQNMFDSSSSQIKSTIKEIFATANSSKIDEIFKKITEESENNVKEKIEAKVKTMFNSELYKTNNKWAWCDERYFIDLMISPLFTTAQSKLLWSQLIVAIWNNLASQNGIFNINTQGDIKTQGLLMLGGLKSGENIWTLNPAASSWIIKYGRNSSDDYNRFFGVALPTGSSTSFGNGIRFNYNSNGIVLNSIGMRTYAYSGGNWQSNFTLQYLKGNNLGIKCNDSKKRLDLYTNGTTTYLVNDFYENGGSYIAFNQDEFALKGYINGSIKTLFKVNTEAHTLSIYDKSENKTYTLKLT